MESDGICGRMMRGGREEERSHIHNTCGMTLTLCNVFSYYFILFFFYFIEEG